MGGGGSLNPIKKNPLKRIERSYNRAGDWKHIATSMLLSPLFTIGSLIDDKIVDPMEDRKRELRTEMDRRNDEQKQIEDDIEKEKDRTAERSSEVSRKARAVSRRLQRAKRRSTILTGGLGVPGEPPTAQKTLLGR